MILNRFGRAVARVLIALGAFQVVAGAAAGRPMISAIGAAHVVIYFWLLTSTDARKS